jgi:hypothetical protein
MSFFFSPSRRAPDASSSSSSSSSAPGGGDEDGGESSVVSALVARLAGFQVEREEALDARRRERDTAQRRLAEAEGVVLDTGDALRPDGPAPFWVRCPVQCAVLVCRFLPA